MDSYDAIIVGSGTIGSFTAYALAKAGLTKLLVADRGGLAAGTSRASDGNLLMSDKSAPGAMFDLMRESLRLWGLAIEDLGNECEYDVKGSVIVTLDHTQVDRLRDHVAAHATHGVRAEFHVEHLTGFEPNLTPSAQAIGWWPDDVQVNPMLACYSIGRHLRARGTVYRFHDAVTAITVRPGGVEVALAGGSRASAGHVVICAGVWTPTLVAPLGIALPILPRKGQICVLERGPVTVRSKIADFAYNDTVDDADPADATTRTAAIIEMTQSGTILCGSSRSFAGFDRSVDHDVNVRILRDCIRVVPGLAGLRVIRAYAGLRPYPPDGLPLIGAVDDHERVIVATGHEGTGHGLAAVTGDLVARLLAGRRPALATGVDPRRFAL